MKRILAVDDSDIDNMIHEIILHQVFPNNEIILYSNPCEAIQYIRQNKSDLPEIILLDISMPVVTGWDLLNELALHHNRSFVFMLTSSISREDEERARKFTFIKDYFIKPLNAGIIAKIRKHTGDSSELQQMGSCSPVA